MLTKEESELVDEYIRLFLSPPEGIYEEIDNFIAASSVDENLFHTFSGLAAHYIGVLKKTIDNEYQEHHAATMSMIAAQERLCQLQILEYKLYGIDYTKELALLCLASSIDLYWLEQQQQNEKSKESNTLEL